MKTKKIDENHLYNVVAQPYRNMSNASDAHSSHSAQPSYEPQATYARIDGAQAPIDIDEDEIPF